MKQNIGIVNGPVIDANRPTLAEDLRYDTAEIESRLRLMNFTDADRVVLIGCLSTIEAHVEEIVEKFYLIQLQNPEISAVIGEPALLGRLQSAMRTYICELFQGNYGDTYVNKRLKIGMVHKRIGVSPKLYISAVNLLELVIEPYICPNTKTEESYILCEQRRHAFHKLLLFDVQLVFDTYIFGLLAEVQSAKAKVENYAADLEVIVAERTRELEALSRLDSLTELGNQRAFYEDMRRELARSERTGESLVLAYFDLNGFKNINDQKGHLVGDELLAMIGRCLKDVSRGTDYCYRYGGDEFCVILSNATIAIGNIFTDRLFERFDKENTHDVSFSAGLVQSGGTYLPTIEQLIRIADDNMYRAKANSKLVPGHKVFCSVLNGQSACTSLNSLD